MSSNMVVDIEIVREFLMGIDAEASKSDPDFITSVDLMIFTIERMQKDKDKSVVNDSIDNDFDSWTNGLAEKEQPTCSISSDEDCEACGS